MAKCVTNLAIVGELFRRQLFEIVDHGDKMPDYDVLSFEDEDKNLFNSNFVFAICKLLETVDVNSKIDGEPLIVMYLTSNIKCVFESVIETFVNGGCDFSVQGRDGNTPLHLIGQELHSSVAEGTYGRNKYALIDALDNVLSNGADPMALDKNGQSIRDKFPNLHLMTWDLSTMKVLIEKGHYDVNFECPLLGQFLYRVLRYSLPDAWSYVLNCPGVDLDRMFDGRCVLEHLLLKTRCKRNQGADLLILKGADLSKLRLPGQFKLQLDFSTTFKLLHVFGHRVQFSTNFRDSFSRRSEKHEAAMSEFQNWKEQYSMTPRTLQELVAISLRKKMNADTVMQLVKEKFGDIDLLPELVEFIKLNHIAPHPDCFVGV